VSNRIFLDALNAAEAAEMTPDEAAGMNAKPLAC